MVDKAAENLNIEKTSWLSWAKKEYIPSIPNIPEKEKDTTEDIKKTEAELAKAYGTIEEAKTTIPQQPTTSPNSVTKAINQLNRPEAAEWLEKAYTTIQQDIENSDTDKNPIARWLGKFIKKLLNQ